MHCTKHGNLFGTTASMHIHYRLTVRRDAFEAEELIYIPPRNHGSNGTWVQPSFCVWNGPEWLRKTPCLKDTYPGLYSFFWVTMGIKNSSWVTVVNEAKCLNASDDVDYIAKVFKAINSSLEEAEVAAIRDVIVESLKTACIFPISAGKSNSLFDYMSTAQDLEMWFIADRWHLKKSFDGIIPILALDVDTIEKIQVLISALGLNHRLLSWAAGENAKVNGITEPHQTFTVALREKAKHIARYAGNLQWFYNNKLTLKLGFYRKIIQHVKK